MDLYVVWENDYWKIKKAKNENFLLRIEQRRTGRIFIIDEDFDYFSNRNWIFAIEFKPPKYLKKIIDHYFKIIKVLP
jgi:hypothetical protein